MPLLSIIILNYKDPAMLRLCLNSILNSKIVADHEIIVVDNESTPETQNVVTEEFTGKFKYVKLLPFRENLAYTRGVNEGIRAASGDHILYLNYDVVVSEGSVDEMLDFYKSRPDIGLLGPEFLNFDGTHQESCFRFYSPFTILFRRIPGLPFAKKILSNFLMSDIDLTSTTPCDWISGAVFMTSRNAIEKVGLLDEKLFHYFSDVDWARRFWENGLKVIYYPHAKVYHYWGRESRGLWLIAPFINKTARWHIMDGMRYFWKNGLSRLIHNF